MIMEKKSFSQMNKQESSIELDMQMLFRDLLRSFCKFWWLGILLAAVLSLFSLLYGVRNYTPMYRAEATFTVETYSAPQSGYTFFYDNRTASTYYPNNFLRN